MSKIINGFVLSDPICPENVFVFSSDIALLPENAVSLQSLAEKVVEDTEIVFFTIGFEELDYKRVKEIVDDNNHIHLSFFSLDNRKPLPYLNLSMLTIDDMALFIPFMLKKYTSAVYVRPGTIFEDLIRVDSAKYACTCYCDNSDKECVYLYNIPLYVDRITLKDIRDKLMESAETQNGKIIDEIIGDVLFKKSKILKYGKNKEGYSDDFMLEAKKTIFYEKLLFDLAQRKSVRKYILDQRPLVHVFPFENIPQGSRVIIYGFGDVGRHYISQLAITGFCETVMVVDKNYRMLLRRGYDIHSPKEITQCDFDYIVIANDSKTIQNEIIKSLIEMNVRQDKIYAVFGRNYRIDNGRVKT